MAIVVENGSVVSGANSYISLADFKLYAAVRGITLPADATVEAYLVKSTDYLESNRNRFVGTLTDRDQSLSWPRNNAIIEGWAWLNNEIPRQVINCQCALAVEQVDGLDMYNPASALPVVRENIAGAVEVEYANPGQAAKVTKTRESQAILRTLLKNSGLMVVRA